MGKKIKRIVPRNKKNHKIKHIVSYRISVPGKKSLKEHRFQLMGNRRTNWRNDEDPVREYADFDMEISRLIAVLLMVLEWTRPALPSPLRPICDLRVLDRFIKEARDAEAAMRGCREGCGLAESLTVPLTSVDYTVWEKKNVQEQAQEVQAGLSLLGQAISVVRSSVSNRALHSLIESSYNNIHSIVQVLNSLNIQEVTSSSGGSEGTWSVSTTSELFRIHTNFLRGKVRLLLSSAPACNQDLS